MQLRLRKSFLALVLVYGIIFASMFYWQVCADLQSHPANPRYYRMFKENRGAIYDRHGEVLAGSTLVGEIYARDYAAVSLSHVVGYFHQRYGMTGLERLYHEDLLRGRSLFTTLDLELQKLAEQALQSQNGAIVVIKPATGEILALVSSPGIDGNSLDESWSDYLTDVRSPFLNRATHGLYPPGSVVKPIIYGVALGKQLAEPTQIWLDEGSLALHNRTISNSGGKPLGDISTDQALALSSNVVFAQLAIALGDDLPVELRRFGLGRDSEFELQNLRGFVPQRVDSDYDAAQLGLGQGELLVTPLQMAVLSATIANGGVMMRPFVVQEVRGGLQMRQITRPRVVDEVWPQHVAQDVRDAMVMAAKEGTARTSFSTSLDYAAKTGTAQTSQGPAHAWFIGFAPSRLPKVAVAVLVEHGGSGGAAAAPIGAMIMAKALQLDE